MDPTTAREIIDYPSHRTPEEIDAAWTVLEEIDNAQGFEDDMPIEDTWRL